MTSRRCFLGLLTLLSLLPGMLSAKDPGRDELGLLSVRVFFGTNGDAGVAGKQTKSPDQETTEKLRAQKQLRFENYRLLGEDTEPVYRSYENWAQPIKGSDEILCRFEVQKRLSADAMRLDLELWLSRKKTLKSGLHLTERKPVLVLGPEWRGGNLIISVELQPEPEQ